MQLMGAISGLAVEGESIKGDYYTGFLQAVIFIFFC